MLETEREQILRPLRRARVWIAPPLLLLAFACMVGIPQGFAALLLVVIAAKAMMCIEQIIITVRMLPKDPERADQDRRARNVAP